MHKFIKFLIFLKLSFLINFPVYSDDFSEWKINFKIEAINSGISEQVVETVMKDARFLPKVIEYDRFQPEFYEDTFTYIKKRSSKNKIKQGLKLYKKEKKIIDIIEKEFLVEKDLLLALMGIETNFGKYLGKMDIVSRLQHSAMIKEEVNFLLKNLSFY